MMSGSPSVDALLDKMGQELSALISQRKIDDPLMIGIHTGGVWLAERLHKQLGLESPMGVLDISFYRDDFHQDGS